MSTRRRFIHLLPLAGWSVLTACGEKAAPPSAAPTPAAAAAPEPAAPAPPPPPPPATAAAPSPAPVAAAGPDPMVDSSDATAVSLGYVPNATTTKNPKYVAGSACGNCALFGGKSGDAAGPCPLYAGKQVAATGWCSAYVKKA